MNPDDQPSDPQERNLYHKEREREFEPAFGDTENIELISAHITKHIAEPTFVFHEFVSDLVHLDVHVIVPTPERNYYTLVTSGMSDRPMTPPAEYAEQSYAELMLCLPPDWPLSEEGSEDLEVQWPVELLKHLARMPHEYETWFAESHTVPNTPAFEHYTPNTKFCAVTFATPKTAPAEFAQLKVADDKTIHFLAVIPLYLAEIKLALKKGSEPLFGLLETNQVTELLDLKRKSLVKRFWFF
jgi:hypothetical protein